MNQEIRPTTQVIKKVDSSNPIVNELNNKNYSQLDQNTKVLLKENYYDQINKSWGHKLKSVLDTNGPILYNQYLSIKDQGMKESALLLKSGKLNKESAFKINMKMHESLKKSFGLELYEKYLKLLREENTERLRKGINFLIKF